MTDLPDRLSVDPDSPFYDEALLARGIGMRFNGNEKKKERTGDVGHHLVELQCLRNPRDINGARG